MGLGAPGIRGGPDETTRESGTGLTMEGLGADLPGRSLRPPDGGRTGSEPWLGQQVMGHHVCSWWGGGGELWWATLRAKEATGPWRMNDLQSPLSPIPLGPFLF